MVSETSSEEEVMVLDFVYLKKCAEEGILPRGKAWLIPQAKEVYDFIISFVEKVGALPKVTTIKEQFKELDFTGDVDKEYAEEQLEERFLRGKVIKLINAEKENIKINPKQAVFKLLRGLIDLAQVDNIKVCEATVGSLIRFRSYLKSPMGLSFEIGFLDEITRGMHPQNLIVVAAQRKTGKTGFLVHLGKNSFNMGRRVLFGTIEESKESIQERFDSRYLGLDIRDMYSDKNIRQRVFQGLRRMRQEQGKFWVVELADLEEIAEYDKQYRPNVVIIDGAYLLAANRGWEEQASLSVRLKKLARYLKVPLIASVQAGRATGEGDLPTLNTIGYSDTWGQDADIVIGLCLDRDLQQLDVGVIGHRRGDIGEGILNWDYENYDFSEMQ